MKTAVVTGANGFVGSHVVRELLAHGYTVRALHREGSDTSTIDDLNIAKFVADIRTPETLNAPFEGADVVFHIAALFRQAKHPDSVYYDINVAGTENVINAAKKYSIPRIVHCSTVGVHSHIPNPPASEDEDYRPGDIYQVTKCEGEKLALNAFRDGGIHGTVIRPAMIWGPGDTRTLKLYRGIAKRKFPLIYWDKTYLHWVMVTDLARAFRLAAEKDIKSGEVFIIAGKRHILMKELFTLIAEQFDVKPPPFALPALPFQLAGDVCELLCKPIGIEPPIYRRRVDFFTKTRSFSIKKAQDLLGYEPAGDVSDEVKTIAEWYRKNGWIS